MTRQMLDWRRVDSDRAPGAAVVLLAEHGAKWINSLMARVGAAFPWFSRVNLLVGDRVIARQGLAGFLVQDSPGRGASALACLCGATQVNASIVRIMCVMLTYGARQIE